VEPARGFVNLGYLSFLFKRQFQLHHFISSVDKSAHILVADPVFESSWNQPSIFEGSGLYSDFIFIADWDNNGLRIGPKINDNSPVYR
jgi:hypothetical protein